MAKTTSTQKRYEELIRLLVAAKHAESHMVSLTINGDVFVIQHLHNLSAKAKDGKLVFENTDTGTVYEGIQVPTTEGATNGEK